MEPGSFADSYRTGSLRVGAGATTVTAFATAAIAAIAALAF